MYIMQRLWYIIIIGCTEMLDSQYFSFLISNYMFQVTKLVTIDHLSMIVSKLSVST